MTRRAVVLILVLHLQLAKRKGPDLPQFARGYRFNQSRGLWLGRYSCNVLRSTRSWQGALAVADDRLNWVDWLIDRITCSTVVVGNLIGWLVTSSHHPLMTRVSSHVSTVSELGNFHIYNYNFKQNSTKKTIFPDFAGFAVFFHLSRFRGENAIYRGAAKSRNSRVPARYVASR